MFSGDKGTQPPPADQLGNDRFATHEDLAAHVPLSPAGNRGQVIQAFEVEAEAVVPIWVRCMDEKTNCSFYFNKDTGATSWTAPGADEETKRLKAEALARANANNAKKKDGRRRRARHADPRNKRRSLLYFPGWNKPKTPGKGAQRLPSNSEM